MDVGVLPTRISVHYMYAGALKRPEGASEHLEIELQMIVSRLVGSGNRRLAL